MAFSTSPLGGDVLWRLYRGVLYALFRPVIEASSISGVRWIKCDDEVGEFVCRDSVNDPFARLTRVKVLEDFRKQIWASLSNRGVPKFFA